MRLVTHFRVHVPVRFCVGALSCFSSRVSPRCFWPSPSAFPAPVPILFLVSRASVFQAEASLGTAGHARCSEPAPRAGALCEPGKAEERQGHLPAGRPVAVTMSWLLKQNWGSGLDS